MADVEIFGGKQFIYNEDGSYTIVEKIAEGKTANRGGIPREAAQEIALAKLDAKMINLEAQVEGIVANGVPSDGGGGESTGSGKVLVFGRHPIDGENKGTADANFMRLRGYGSSKYHLIPGDELLYVEKTTFDGGGVVTSVIREPGSRFANIFSNAVIVMKDMSPHLLSAQAAANPADIDAVFAPGEVPAGCVPGWYVMVADNAQKDNWSSKKILAVNGDTLTLEGTTVARVGYGCVFSGIGFDTQDMTNISLTFAAMSAQPLNVATKLTL